MVNLYFEWNFSLAEKENMRTTHLAIIDDHEVVINGLKGMLAGTENLQIVFTTTSGEALLQHVANHHVDVILMDIQMPEISGIDLCRMVHKKCPDCKIIAFSSFDDTHYVRQIMRNGALGYLLKTADKETLLKAIETVMGYEEFIDGHIKNLLLRESITGQRRSMFEIPLTKREKEILKLVANENSNQQIADQLFISLRTVETHRLNITQKLGVKNVAGLVKEALKRGLIE
jgi:DNA-binding NarL/FixJ family response regulator